MNLSRRSWMAGLAAEIAHEIADAQQHAQKAAGFAILDRNMAADIEALTAQIIPSGDGPGAREACVVYFIDRALETFEADKREAYHAGMKDVQAVRRKLFPNSSTIAGLTAAQQIEVLRAIEKSDFFELLRTHTVWGFVGSPAYGGNRGKVGWTHIGFDDRMHFKPPFGYYDAQAQGRNS